MILKRVALVILLMSLCAGACEAQLIVTPVAGVATIDVATCGQGAAGPNPSCSFKLTLTANATIAFNNVFSGAAVNLFINPATFTVTWPASVPTPPTLTASTNNSVSLRFDGTTATWLVTSGGGISSTTSANQLDPTQAPYSIKADGYIFNDGTTTNTQPTFSSASKNCATADVGKLMIVVNGSTGGYPYGLGLVTVLSCNGNSWTLSANATSSIAGTANWAIGTDGGPGLASASTAAVSSPPPGKILALPCGVILVSVAPFQSGAVNSFNARPDIEGCNSTMGTTFVLHPNVSAAVLANGGNIFYQYTPAGAPATGLYYNGLGGTAKVESIMITSLGGNIPGTAGKTYTIIDQFGGVNNLGMFGIGMTNGVLNAINFSQGEASASHVNLQHFGEGSGSGATYQGVAMQGQGINTVEGKSIFAFGFRPAISCAGGANCVVTNSYLTNVAGGIGMTGSGGTLTLTGTHIDVVSTSSFGAISDNSNPATFYIFGNPSISTLFATGGAILLFGAGTVADISGTSISSASGFNITGTGTVNDRAGNTFSSPLTQFTGKYIPVGGGTPANNSSSAATNFGVNLGATNVFSIASPASATYKVNIGFRQVTAGVGCGAGSNTVTGVLSWTSGGVTQSTGSNGVPALGTLTMSANGAVGGTGTTNAYVIVPLHIDINTQVTFTTTSVLASAGCSTTPQYVVDFSNI